MTIKIIELTGVETVVSDCSNMSPRYLSDFFSAAERRILGRYRPFGWSSQRLPAEHILEIREIVGHLERMGDLLETRPRPWTKNVWKTGDFLGRVCYKLEEVVEKGQFQGSA